MDIVYVLNNKYLMPTVVSATSLIKYNKCNLHFICTKDVDTSKLNIQDNVTVYQMDNLDLPNFNDNVNKYASMLKFLMTDIIESDKCLFLDGDTLIKDSLEEMYNIDLGDNYAACVKDTSCIFGQRVDLPNYFNSGVMLLNLKKMREDNIKDKLIEAKKNQQVNLRIIDQEAFNMVFNGKVFFLPLDYNFQFVYLNGVSIQDINKTYNGNYLSYYDALGQCKIVHYSSYVKPWENPLLECSEDWYLVYRETSIYDKEKDLLDKYNKIDVVVSLTTYPDRIGYVPYTIQSIWENTIKPNRVVLYLSAKDFQGQIIPQPIQAMQQAGKVEVKWVEDNYIGHKKYYYALQDYPDSVVITVDDDMIYSNRLIFALLGTYFGAPDCIISGRTNLMTFEDNKLLSYKYWIKDYAYCNVPSMKLLATGNGGILYPPHLLTLPTKEQIEEFLYQDDLLLKYLEVEQGIAVKHPSIILNNREINGAQGNALYKENVFNGGNDKAMQKIQELDKNFIEKVIQYDKDIQATTTKGIYLAINGGRQ